MKNPADQNDGSFSSIRANLKKLHTSYNGKTQEHFGRCARVRSRHFAVLSKMMFSGPKTWSFGLNFIKIDFLIAIDVYFAKNTIF